MDYSVLMSVYKSEKADYLRLAMNSMWNQTVPTNDFVLMCDGPLTPELDTVIDEMTQQHPGTLRVVRFEKNGGLGHALQVGVKECKNELIARMDSDDISRPERCEKELAVFAAHPELSIVGSVIEEFTEIEPGATVPSAINPALQMYQMKARIEYNYKTSVVLSLGSVLGSTLCSLIMVLLCSNKLFGRVSGFFVPVIILNIGIYVVLIKRAKFISTKYWKYALTISIPLIWHTLAGNLLNSSDRIMITRFCGKSDNALYSIAYSCAIIVSVLWASMNTAWSPWAYEKMDEENYSALRKASKPYMLFFGLVVFCFLLVAPEVLMLMGGKKYITRYEKRSKQDHFRL